ncbi:hypothetical protein P5673_028270, partial [Acropora cervicornis]
GMPSSKRDLRSECPVGFEPVNFNDLDDCPAVEDDGSSLWLIKVPHDFDVSTLSGQEVILNGSCNLPASCISTKNQDKKYEVHSKANGAAELPSYSVLLPSPRKKTLRAGDPYQRITEEDPSGNSSQDSTRSVRESERTSCTRIENNADFDKEESPRIKKKKKKKDKERNEIVIKQEKLESGDESENRWRIETQKSSGKCTQDDVSSVNDKNTNRSDSNGASAKKKRKAVEKECVGDDKVKRRLDIGGREQNRQTTHAMFLGQQFIYAFRFCEILKEHYAAKKLLSNQVGDYGSLVVHAEMAYPPCCCCPKPESHNFVETLEQRIKDTFQENEIIRKAVFFASLEHQRSSGRRQDRGVGALILTSEVLWFALLSPDKRISIPLQNIRAVNISVTDVNFQIICPFIINFVEDASDDEDQVVIV